eukprot:CAMPEP_0202830076 /NCGR_PEP_ID=MMETSP1389-20130828/15928_1 /ASSEMBLY_ACC=CAM_ASM_000865 /TAXON_ID=302021 /ORGANISM="Rhodomonas sp., Strain CCMP768" /LENGTH=98 /DNA_ID=CAMNT_0049503685 /DNA_START=332 /DNA_END=628 /DNA_ORIENTATION=+
MRRLHGNQKQHRHVAAVTVADQDDWILRRTEFRVLEPPWIRLNRVDRESWKRLSLHPAPAYSRGLVGDSNAADHSTLGSKSGFGSRKPISLSTSCSTS